MDSLNNISPYKHTNNKDIKMVLNKSLRSSSYNKVPPPHQNHKKQYNIFRIFITYDVRYTIVAIIIVIYIIYGYCIANTHKTQ